MGSSYGVLQIYTHKKYLFGFGCKFIDVNSFELGVFRTMQNAKSLSISNQQREGGGINQKPTWFQT